MTKLLKMVFWLLKASINGTTVKFTGYAGTFFLSFFEEGWRFVTGSTFMFRLLEKIKKILLYCRYHRSTHKLRLVQTKNSYQSGCVMYVAARGAGHCPTPSMIIICKRMLCAVFANNYSKLLLRNIWKIF